MAQVCCRIPDENREKLEKIAAADRRSLSFVINDAIEFYLSKVEKVEAEEDRNSNAAE